MTDTPKEEPVEPVNRHKDPTLKIKFVTKSIREFRTRTDHLQIQPPHQKLVCYHCGYWISPYPQTSTGSVPIKIFKAISDTVRAGHRRCRPQPEGRERYIQLHREWDDFMERWKSEREEWEKDYETKWVRKTSEEWGLEYDAWMARPYEKKGKKA